MPQSNSCHKLTFPLTLTVSEWVAGWLAVNGDVRLHLSVIHTLIPKMIVQKVLLPLLHSHFHYFCAIDRESVKSCFIQVLTVHSTITNVGSGWLWLVTATVGRSFVVLGSCCSIELALAQSVSHSIYNRECSVNQ